MPATFHYREFRSEADVEKLDEYVRDSSDISLGTGHPQGGNPISTDRAKGVVGPDFKVHGMANLYVCDASVFPTSITVNPQMTVMALAEYAASYIKSRQRASSARCRAPCRCAHGPPARGPCTSRRSGTCRRR